MAEQAKDDWQKAMTELAHEEPELLQHFQKLSEAAGKVGKAWRYNHSHILSLYPEYLTIHDPISFSLIRLNILTVFLWYQPS